ncbi:hypothetical protein QJS66_09250 [Kocuria rhizophila]|nr:hypothetical protein QJS66_09250 [Kocuria rhizophila]
MITLTRCTSRPARGRRRVGSNSWADALEAHVGGHRFPCWPHTTTLRPTPVALQRRPRRSALTRDPIEAVALRS